MSVKSETVSSASASSASTRSRVSSPAALSAVLRASNPSLTVSLDIERQAPAAWAGSHYIRISLYVEITGHKPHPPLRAPFVGSTPRPRCAGLDVRSRRVRIRHERETRLWNTARRAGGRSAGEAGRGRLLHRDGRHAVDDPVRVPKERTRVGRGVHGRTRPALCARAQGCRELLASRAALLDGQGAAEFGAAGARPLRHAARHLRAALAGAAQSDRDERCQATWHRW